MTIELLDTEEAQTEDPVEVQVSLFLSSTALTLHILVHTTYHSGTVLVTSLTVLIAKSIPM